MSDMFFVIKVFLFTAVVVAIMQIKIGDRNIEQHSQNWLHSSSLVHTLNTVSNGANKLITDGYHYIGAQINSANGNKQASSSSGESKTSAPKKQGSFSFHHGLDIRHELHQAKEKIEEEGSKVEEELKSEL